MATRVDDVVLEGGAWATGPSVAAPQMDIAPPLDLIDPLERFGRDHAPQVSRDELHDYKIILPGQPNRNDVPAPAQSPWNGVVLLNFRQRGNLVTVGSGFFCQPDVILTARHNLESASDEIGAWPGFDARHNPHVGSYAIRAWASHRTLDLAVFVTASASSTVFSLGGGVPPPHAGVTLGGFSMPYSNGDVRYSYAIGAVTSTDSEGIGYAINTRGGDSGAPVFVVQGATPIALGVHTEAAPLPGAGNAGVLLSPKVVADVHKLIAYARSQVRA